MARHNDIARSTAEFPLGRFRDPRKWSARTPFGLPPGIVNQHTLVLGPTRQGKTASVIAPWIYSALQQGYSVVAVDVKGNDDLLGEIKRISSAMGPLGVSVAKWDYSHPARSVSWNWIHNLAGESEINAAVEAICGRPDPSDPNKFFHQSAIKYLRGLLQLRRAIPNVSFDAIIGVLNRQDRLEALVAANTGHPGATRLDELVGMSQGEYLKFTMELKTHLETLDTGGFKAVTDRDQFRFEMLDEQRPLLMIVSAPIADGQLASASSGLFLGQLLQYIYAGFGQQRRPLLLALDEAARLQDRIELGSALSLVAGAGTSMLLAAQDVSQFDDEDRDEILANCGTVICLPRVSKVTTDFFSGRLGDMYFSSRTQGYSSGGAGGGGYTWTHGQEKGVVLGHREIASPHPLLGEWPGFVHCPSLSSRPIVVDLTRQDLLA